MNLDIDKIRARLSAIQDELEQELKEKQAEFLYTIENGKIRFEAAAKKAQRQFRQGVLPYLKSASVMYIITAPFIYIVLVPFVLLDLLITIYQRVCFPVYGIPQVKRSLYLKLDRHKLHYLNIIQKLNCEYCSYGNGVLAYAMEISGRTELFWCPIKHAHVPKGTHQNYYEFLDYGDMAFNEKLPALRKKACEGCQSCAAGGDISSSDSK